MKPCPGRSTCKVARKATSPFGALCLRRQSRKGLDIDGLSSRSSPIHVSISFATAALNQPRPSVDSRPSLKTSCKRCVGRLIYWDSEAIPFTDFQPLTDIGFLEHP